MNMIPAKENNNHFLLSFFFLKKKDKENRITWRLSLQTIEKIWYAGLYLAYAGDINHLIDAFA